MKKYQIKKLEEYTPAYKGKKDFVSINTNHKGSLIQLSKNENIKFLVVLDFKCGKSARGNHYHKVKDEYFYLVQGKLAAYFKDCEGGSVDHHIIESGTLIHIEPGCVHAFETIEEGYAIEYAVALAEDMASDTFYEEIVANDNI